MRTCCQLLAANPGPAWALVAERRPDRPVLPMAGTAAIGAVVNLLATAIEEGRDPPR